MENWLESWISLKLLFLKLNSMVYFIFYLRFDVMGDTSGESFVYLQLNHYFLMVYELWQTAAIFLLKVWDVVQLFLKVAVLVVQIMSTFYFHPFPVSNSPFERAFRHEEWPVSFLFSYCRLSLIILVHAHFLVYLLDLFL